MSGISALEMVSAGWLRAAAESDALADRLGEGHSTHNELRRDAAQYRQCAQQVDAAIALMRGQSEVVAHIHDYGDRVRVVWDKPWAELPVGTKLYADQLKENSADEQ